MPTRDIGFVPQPFVRGSFVPPTATLGDALRRRGDLEGQMALTRGQGTANVWAGLAHAFGQYQQAVKQQQMAEAAYAQKERERQEELSLKRSEMEQRRQEREAAAAARQSTDARLQRAESRAEAADTQPGIISSEVAERLKPSGRVQILDGAPVLMRTPQQARQAEIDKANAQRAEAEAAARAKPKMHSVTVDDGRGNPVAKLVTEEELTAGVPAYRAPRDGNAEPLVAIMGPDGTPVLVPRSQAVGQRPASNREQGRAVTSGDANRIADLDNSLNDLGVLTNTVTGSTGTSAKIGAMLPNWVTELTGRGVSAKQKQASIDRVKQVIGKALEGGVLRKEDEIKYEKILPTIYDPPQVVETKLKGLQDALTLRRQTTLEALADAGYDTSKFETRAQVNEQPISAVPDLSGLRKGAGRKFTTGPFAGQTWALDDNGKPFKVGG